MLSRKPWQIWPKKQTEYLWTNKYSSGIYQNAFGKVKKAFSRWREPKIKAELPRFKKKKHHCSFTVDSSNGKVLVTEGKKSRFLRWELSDWKKLSQINCVSQTFTITISRVAPEWYVSFATFSAGKIPPDETQASKSRNWFRNKNFCYS